MPDSRATVLVAEDDPALRDLVRAWLGVAGHDAHIARNGVDALERVVDLRPAVLILDINMPKMDGFAVLEHMRRRDLFTQTAVLMLTARHASDDVIRAVALGAKDFLTKPFNETQLTRRVARLLRPRPPSPAAQAVLL